MNIGIAFLCFYLLTAFGAAYIPSYTAGEICHGDAKARWKHWYVNLFFG